MYNKGMLKQKISIQSIPAILWGEPSDRVYIFVHGKMSRKEEAEGFAQIADSKGYQVISFDLPEHGERKAEDTRCTVQNAIHDLSSVGDFVLNKWKNVSLFGNSVGAYFSLVAYREFKFEKCLFLSPILDMQDLIRRMLKWFDVTEDLLRARQEIPTPMGETLSWPYYAFVRENPIVKWSVPTYILYGTNDDLTPRKIVDAFVARFDCHLDVLENGEHYFHTREQMAVVDRWLNQNI